MSTKYTNPISITSARRIVVQQPVDDRGQFDTIADVTASIVADEHYGWFEYMLTYLHEVHQVCSWLDAANLPTGVDGDDLIPGTVGTYPGGFPDVQYAGKTFGLYSLRSVPVAHSHVEADITDLDKYTQAEVDAFLAAKQASLPSNATGSIAYLTKNAADNAFSWVVLTSVTAPTNTGDIWAYLGTGWTVVHPNPSLIGVQGSTNAATYIPVVIELAAGTHNLVDPATLPNGYSMIVFHDNVSASPVQLAAYQVENLTVPLQIPQYKSIHIMVSNNKWRRVDNFT